MATALVHRRAQATAPAPGRPSWDDGHVADVIPLRPRVAPRPRHVVWVRRLVVATAAVAVAALVVGAVALVVPDVPPPAAATTTVQLQPGDTLWELAADATPAGGDPRVTLRRIRELNGFETSSVPAWTTVLVPAR